MTATEQSPAAPAAPTAPAAAAVQPGVTRFIAPDDVETQVFEWGTLKWLPGPRLTGGGARFSTGVALLQPGKAHTRHNHPGVEEILYVVSGEGDQMVEDPAGQPVRRPVRAGMLIHIPPDVYHET